MKAGKEAATTVMPLISADSKRKSRVKIALSTYVPFCAMIIQSLS